MWRDFANVWKDFQCRKKSTKGSNPVTSHPKTGKTGKQIKGPVDAKANLHTPDGLRMALVAVGNVQQVLVSQLNSARKRSILPKRSKCMIIKGMIALIRNPIRLHQARESRTHAAILGAYFFDLLRRQLPQATRGCDTASHYGRYSFHCKASTAADYFMFPVRDIWRQISSVL